MSYAPWILLTVALAFASLALAGCGTSVPTTSAPPSNPPTANTHDPSPDPIGSAPNEFDLSGSAWRVTSLIGQVVPAENAPGIEFDWLGRPSGTGFTGCDEFGFNATFRGGRASVGDLILNPSGCGGPGAAIERTFLMTFRAAESWSVDGDRLALGGAAGHIVFVRELPPIGDPGRSLAEALQAGEWRVLRAPGVVGLERLPPLTFADVSLIAAGNCGLSGDIHFGMGGALDITEVGWDTAGCVGPNDGRPALQRLLEAVTSGGVGPEGTIVLSGPLGEVVLGR